VTSSPARPDPNDRIASVAVPVPGLGLLSYLARRTFRSTKARAVRVPLGSRAVIGCVVDPQATGPIGGEIARASPTSIDREPFIPPTSSISRCGSASTTPAARHAVALAMPPAARSGELESFRTTRLYELGAAPDAGEKRTARQQAALDALTQQPGGMAAAALTKAGVSPATLRTLVGKGWARAREAVVLADPFGEGGDGGPWSVGASAAEAPQLTTEQMDAYRRLEDAAAAQTFQTVLLHGVTGSGKTELYLRLAARVIGFRPARAGAGPGNWAHAVGHRPVPRALRRPRGDSAQRPVRRRTA
jgi:primosomal protein N' (replication factor Y)